MAREDDPVPYRSTEAARAAPPAGEARVTGSGQGGRAAEGPAEEARRVSVGALQETGLLY